MEALAVLLLLALVIVPIALLGLAIGTRKAVTRLEAGLDSLRESHREIEARLAANEGTSGVASPMSGRLSPQPVAEPQVAGGAAEASKSPESFHVGAGPEERGEAGAIDAHAAFPPAGAPAPALAGIPALASRTASPPPLPREHPPVAVPAVAAVAAAEPSRFEEAAREILGKIWNWLVVGEEHRPAGVTMEYAVASTWLIRAGVIILLVGIGFFLRYTIAFGILGPTGKVILAILAGVAMLIGGIRLLRGQYSLLGQGLSGAGFATLYISFFTAHGDALIGSGGAFGLMVLVTVAAGVISLRFSSMLVAVLGLAGGYLTPLLVGSGDTGVGALFAYLLILGAGVLYLAARSDWRFLHYLSFAGTWLLVGAALAAGRFEAGQFWLWLPFFAAYFALFSTVTFIHQILKREKATLLELIFLFLNAGVFLGFAWEITTRVHPQEAVALVTLGLSLFYLGHIVMFQRRGIRDRGLMMSFLGLASLFAAISLPLVLSGGWITVSWSAQAFVMLWIASKMRSDFLRQLAYVLYLLVLARFAILDLHGQFGSLGSATAAGEAGGGYWRAFLERLAVLGMPIGSFFAAGWLFLREQAEGAADEGEARAMRPWFSESPHSRASFWIVLAMAFLYLSFEAFHSAGVLFDPLRLPALTLVWLAFGAILLRQWIAGDAGLARALFWGLAVLVMVKVFALHFLAYGGLVLVSHAGFGWESLGAGPLLRLLEFGALIAFLLLAWRILGQRPSEGAAAALFGYTALAGTLLYTSMEVWTGLGHYLKGFQLGGLSIYWALFAVGLLLAGILNGVGPLRRVGLALMAVTVAKVFLVDLAGLEQLYRIVAFIVLGLLVLASSFLYMKHRHRFVIGAEGESATGEPGESQP